jgi:hypothetical protein
MRAGVECPPGDRYVAVEVASYCGLIPAASMIRAALSLSRSTNRVKSGCVMLIGSPPWFASEARNAGVWIGKSKPGTPASATVGTSGSALGRRALLKPSGRSLC